MRFGRRQFWSGNRGRNDGEGLIDRNGGVGLTFLTLGKGEEEWEDGGGEGDVVFKVQGSGGWFWEKRGELGV